METDKLSSYHIFGIVAIIICYCLTGLCLCLIIYRFYLHIVSAYREQNRRNSTAISRSGTERAEATDETGASVVISRRNEIVRYHATPENN